MIYDVVFSMYKQSLNLYNTNVTLKGLILSSITAQTFSWIQLYLLFFSEIYFFYNYYNVPWQFLHKWSVFNALSQYYNIINLVYQNYVIDLDVQFAVEIQSPLLQIDSTRFRINTLKIVNNGLTAIWCYEKHFLTLCSEEI